MVIKDENYITIQGWMITRLGLKGNELLIYAIIYGFSQNYQSSFSGSLKYLSDFTNFSRRTVLNCLQSLTAKGLLIKQDRFTDGIKTCEYNAAEGGEKNSPGVVQNFHEGGEKTAPNNTINITNDITIDNTREYKNVQRVAELYNEICISFPRLRALSDARKKAVKARLKVYELDDFKALFEKAEASNFLKGGNGRNWSATFDWLIKDSNMAKVLDGNYDNKNGKQTGRNGVEVLPESEKLHDLDGIF